MGKEYLMGKDQSWPICAFVLLDVYCVCGCNTELNLRLNLSVKSGGDV